MQYHICPNIYTPYLLGLVLYLYSKFALVVDEDFYPLWHTCKEVSPSCYEHLHSHGHSTHNLHCTAWHSRYSDSWLGCLIFGWYSSSVLVSSWPAHTCSLAVQNLLQGDLNKKLTIVKWAAYFDGMYLLTSCCISCICSCCICCIWESRPRFRFCWHIWFNSCYTLYIKLSWKQCSHECRLALPSCILEIL